MKLTIICVGKIKEKFYREALGEYAKRLSKYCSLSVIEVADESTQEQLSSAVNEHALKKEGERILNKIPDTAYVIATAIEGRKYDSVGFSDILAKLLIGGKSHIAFIIGGSLGLHKTVKERADSLISFSEMTFPHQLMRVILSEQIYRAFKIIQNEPYHK